MLVIAETAVCLTPSSVGVAARRSATRRRSRVTSAEVAVAVIEIVRVRLAGGDDDEAFLTENRKVEAEHVLVAG